MKLFSIYLLLLFSFLFIVGCAEKTTYSGKIISLDDLQIKALNKNELINTFGQPSYIDPLLNKYFYFIEKRKSKNFYNKKLEYSYLFVFEIDNEDKIISSESINLLANKNHKYKEEETQNNIIKRGLLEKIFGGIGPNQIPNSP